VQAQLIQEKVSELERFYEAVEGRELRRMELETENKALRQSETSRWTPKIPTTLTIDGREHPSRALDGRDTFEQRTHLLFSFPLTVSLHVHL
jgi:hypothetical protein